MKDIADERHWRRMIKKDGDGLYGIDFSGRTLPPQPHTPRPSAIEGQKRQTVTQNNSLSFKALKMTGHGANISNPLVYNSALGIIPNLRFALFWDDPPRVMTLYQDFKSCQMLACGSSLDTRLITQHDTLLQLLLADPEGNSAIEIDSSSVDMNLHANPTRVNSETPILLDSVLPSPVSKRQKGKRQRIEAKPRSTRKPKAKVL